MITVSITRREFRTLPLETQRRIMAEQADKQLQRNQVAPPAAEVANECRAYLQQIELAVKGLRRSLGKLGGEASNK